MPNTIMVERYSGAEILAVLDDSSAEAFKKFATVADNGRVICFLCCSTTSNRDEWNRHFKKEHHYDAATYEEGFCFVCNKTVIDDLENRQSYQAHMSAIKHQKAQLRTLQYCWCPTCGSVHPANLKQHPHPCRNFTPLLDEKEWESFLATAKTARRAVKEELTIARQKGFSLLDASLQSDTSAYIRTLIFIISNGHKNGDRVNTRGVCEIHFERQTDKKNCPVPSFRRETIAGVCVICANIKKVTGHPCPSRIAFTYSVTLEEVAKAGHALYVEEDSVDAKAADDGKDNVGERSQAKTSTVEATHPAPASASGSTVTEAPAELVGEPAPGEATILLEGLQMDGDSHM